jgi:hypothetical protein
LCAPSAWGPETVARAFDELGLDVFEFDHTCTGLSFNQSTASPQHSRVVTGILRAPKSDGKECFVLVVEYDSRAKAHVLAATVESPSGLSTALLLMQVLSSKLSERARSR